MDPWRPYAPSASAPWDLERVVHLHRGAGFGASPAEVRRDLEQGFEASLARVLEGRVRAAPPDFDELQASLAERAVTRGDARHLQAWWVWRMLVGPDPLRERLTLFWHDHFATSQLKVRDLVAMHRQNEVFRRDALAPFGQLLAHSVKEPALLLWLDAETNRKGHPNENLARELMELFTLGIGNYTERDVKEAARALTGWIVRDEEFVDRDVRHDEGEKEILGQRGAWTGDDLLRILLAHPATARRLALKLTREFLGQGVADEAALGALSSGLSAHGLDVRWAVETILRSELFFSAATRGRGVVSAAMGGRRVVSAAMGGRRVIGPAEFVVGTARALALHEPPPSTLILSHWTTRAGQDLFFPPNVGGWPGGLAWLAPGELVARANYVEALIAGRGTARPALDDASLARELAPLAGELEPREILAVLLLGRRPADTEDGRVVPAHSPALVQTLPDLARVLLSGPEAHLA